MSDGVPGPKAALVAEAVAKHYERARDSTGLYEAVQVKLGGQRRFVLWWDGQERRKATPGNLGPSQTGDDPAAVDFGLDRDTIHRWRKRLKDPRKFDVGLEKVHERCVKVCEAHRGHSDLARATNGGENEWHAPAGPGVRP